MRFNFFIRLFVYIVADLELIVRSLLIAKENKRHAFLTKILDQ